MTLSLRALMAVAKVCKLSLFHFQVLSHEVASSASYAPMGVDLACNFLEPSARFGKGFFPLDRGDQGSFDDH